MYDGHFPTELECEVRGVPGSQKFLCGFSNNVESVTCSHDDGPFENCSFPLVVGIDEFDTDNHTLVVTVVDVFELSVNLFFHIRLTGMDGVVYLIMFSVQWPLPNRSGIGSGLWSQSAIYVQITKN